MEENFPTLKNEMATSIKEAYRTPNSLDQKINTSQHIIVKTPSVQSKERILKAIRKKGHVTLKGRPITITPYFSKETMKARRFLAGIMQTVREYKSQSKLLYPAKISITIEGEIKIFQDKTKFTQYLTTNPTLQQIIGGKQITTRRTTS